MRAQRVWWERNGAFFRGFILGAFVATLLAFLFYWIRTSVH
jgi:hypothetical protein